MRIVGESYFDGNSMLQRVHRERVLALGGPRALLMMAAHPVAFAGFFAHTGDLDAPYERLARTAEVLRLIGFGPRVEADRVTRRVRAIHRSVKGTLAEPVGRCPAGTPYAGDDPELLLWILACLVDSLMLVHDRYVRPLTAVERDGLWADYRVVGRLFGLRLRDMPASARELDQYMADMIASGDLHLSDPARELGVQIVLRPPVPWHTRPLLELANFITVGLLPGSIRRMYGLSWDPVREVALWGGAEYSRRVVVPLLPDAWRLTPGAREAAA